MKARQAGIAEKREVFFVFLFFFSEEGVESFCRNREKKGWRVEKGEKKEGAS